MVHIMNLKRKSKKASYKISPKTNLSIDLLKQLVSEYEYSGQLDNNLVEEVSLVAYSYVLRKLIMLNPSSKKP